MRLMTMSALAVALLGAAAPAAADAPMVILDRGQLPFDLGPGHPANHPARASNAPYAAWNSSGNTANSSQAWENRPSNPANGKRLIFTADGEVRGYYAQNAGGVLNLFDAQGRRVAYRPARGTKSLFSVSGQWCGTVDEGRGGMILAMTLDCARELLRD